jgi:mono/diheme cytochrome c family protein
LGVVVTACGSFDLGDEKPTEIAVDAENPNWNADIRPLMALKCMNCHATPAPRHAPKGTPVIALSSEGVFKQASMLNRIWTRVYNTPGKPMPPDYATPLSTAERIALKNYLASNGVDTRPSATPTPSGGGSHGGDTGGGEPTLSVAYGQSCVGCHAADGGGKDGNPNLKGTKLTEAAYKAKVRAGGGPMPPFDAGAISDADLAADWKILKAAK